MSAGPITGLAWRSGLGAFQAVARPLRHEGRPFALTPLAIGALPGLAMPPSWPR